MEEICMPEDYYMNLHKDMKELPLLKKPCEDCAVECSLYSPYSEDLKNNHTKEVQEFVSKRWYCHNHVMCACKGNAELLGISWKIDKKSPPTSIEHPE